MKTTRYFDEQVLRKRPYIERQWCIDAVISPVRREIQADGRIRHWGLIKDASDGKARYLRVITLADGETIHTPSLTGILRRIGHEAALLPRNRQPLY